MKRKDGILQIYSTSRLVSNELTLSSPSFTNLEASCPKLRIRLACSNEKVLKNIETKMFCKPILLIFCNLCKNIAFRFLWNRNVVWGTSSEVKFKNVGCKATNKIYKRVEFVNILRCLFCFNDMYSLLCALFIYLIYCELYVLCALKHKGIWWNTLHPSSNYSNP